MTNHLEVLPPSQEDDRIRWATFYRIYTDAFLSRYASGGDIGARREIYQARRWGGLYQPLGLYSIHIVVRHGQTTLYGVVDSDADKQMAEVQGARGVRRLRRRERDRRGQEGREEVGGRSRDVDVEIGEASAVRGGRHRVCAASPSRAHRHHLARATEALAPELSGLGTLHVPVSTAVPRAQRFFDQGMRLLYAFNHAESIRAFREAARLDPSLAMAYWGQALALGPEPQRADDARERSRGVRGRPGRACRGGTRDAA